MENIIAKYYLGFEQGKEIINWANQSLKENIQEHADLLIELSLLNKHNSWENSIAERLFINYFRPTEEEIESLIQGFLYNELIQVVNGTYRPYRLIEILDRIDKKFNSPYWTYNLLNTLAFVLPDSKTTGLSKASISEMSKVLANLKILLNKNQKNGTSRNST